jgi:hypothetical protein
MPARMALADSQVDDGRAVLNLQDSPPSYAPAEVEEGSGGNQPPVASAAENPSV